MNEDVSSKDGIQENPITDLGEEMEDHPEDTEVESRSTEISFLGVSVSHYIHSKSPLFGKSINEKFFEPMDVLEVALRANYDDDFIFFLVGLLEK